MLSAPEEDGQPLIEHLRVLERRTGKTPQILLDAPECPDGCAHLWGIFNELHRCRGAGFSAPMPITFVDLDAWQRINGAVLAKWEVDALKAADSAYLVDWNERHQQT